MQDSVCIWRAADGLEANLIKSLLETSGIPVAVFDVLQSGMGGELGMLPLQRIMVPQSRFDEAVNVLFVNGYIDGTDYLSNQGVNLTGEEPSIKKELKRVAWKLLITALIAAAFILAVLGLGRLL